MSTVVLNSQDIAALNQKGKSKYGAVKCTCDGFKFDSKLEMNTYLVLKGLHDRGIIKNLLLQQPFQLHGCNNVKIAKYVADFVCEFESGSKCIVESKGVETPAWRIKKKLFYAEYNTPIVVVTSKNLSGLFSEIIEISGAKAK